MLWRLDNCNDIAVLYEDRSGVATENTESTEVALENKMNKNQSICSLSVFFVCSVAHLST